MNNDLISREELKIELTKQIAYFDDRAHTTSLKNDTFAYNHCKVGLMLAVQIVDNAPTVEPEPVSERQKRALAIVDALTEKHLINVMERGCLRRSIILEPERPHGEWIRKYNGHRADICCTNCGYDEGYSCFKYCPHCGAYMKGGTE